MLVLQTMVLGGAGQVYVLDMGEPVKIVDLARDLIRLSGYDADEIGIEFTGLRPGEKLFEELFLSGEKYERTAHPKIFATRNGAGKFRTQNSDFNLQPPNLQSQRELPSANPALSEAEGKVEGCDLQSAEGFLISDFRLRIADLP